MGPFLEGVSGVPTLLATSVERLRHLNPISNCLPSFFFPLNRVLLQPLRDFLYLAQIEPFGPAFALSKNGGQEGVLKITRTTKSCFVASRVKKLKGELRATDQL